MPIQNRHNEHLICNFYTMIFAKSYQILIFECVCNFFFYKPAISDRPDAPRFPVVENIRDDSVVLSWKPPLNDGGSFITEYVIERMEPPNGNWCRVTSTR